MKQFPLILLIAAAALTFFMLQQPAAALPGGAKPVETHNGFDIIRTGPEIDGVVKVEDQSGAPLGQFYLAGGQLYEDPDTKQPARLTLNRTRYLIDPALDLGCFAAGSSIQGQDRFQAGLRVSPVRLGYGTIAIDGVASQHQAGLGVSIYPPVEYFGQAWRHIGIGAWYCVPYDQDLQPGWAFGLGFSTRN